MANSAVQTTPSNPTPQPPVRRIPPGPFGNPLVGILPRLADPLDLYTDSFRRYGDVVRLRTIPTRAYYMVAHPEGIEHVLSRNAKNYRKPDAFSNPVRMIAGDGLLVTEGETWQRTRRLMTPAFARERLDRMSEVFIRLAESTADRWESIDPDKPIDLAREMMGLTLRIASETLFGVDVPGGTDAFAEALRVGFHEVNLRMTRPLHPPMWLPVPRIRRFKAAQRHLRSTVLSIIAERRGSGARAKDDLLGRLLQARDSEDGKGLTDLQLIDESITLLVAGHDTVGAALAWCWWQLGQHPEAMRRLQAEVDSLDGGRPPALADLPKLQWTRQVFEETMRLHPPAWGVPRETLEDDEIMGYHIPKKNIVTLLQVVTHRHPDFWPNPDVFDPERFAPGAGEGRPKYAYFPFGGGPRACIGAAFAMAEGPLVLATLARRFDVALVPDVKVEMDPTFVLKPKPGVFARLRKRR